MKIFGLACLAAVNPKLLAWQILTALTLIVGGYMVLSGTLRLLG